MKHFVALLLSLAALAVHAQQLEILTLRFRNAEQVVPQLQPLVAPGGALTGSGSKLFVRTTPNNLADLKRVLAEIDREPRRLLVSVRRGGELRREASGAGVGGTAGSGNVRIWSSGGDGGRGGSVEIRNGETVIRGNAYEARTRGSEDVAQQVQTVEGGRAFISVGRSVPVPVRRRVVTPTGSVVVTDAVEYREIDSGFYAEPRVSGDRVTLDISSANDRPVGSSGVAETQRLSTTVSGRLGEWIELGGMSQESTEERGDVARYSTRGTQDERRVWLKVEELR